MKKTHQIILDHQITFGKIAGECVDERTTIRETSEMIRDEILEVAAKENNQ